MSLDLNNIVLIDKYQDEKNRKVDLEDIENKIIGIMFYKKWKKTYSYFYSLDIKRGRIKCYKKMEQKKVSRSIYLSKVKIEKTESNQIIIQKKKFDYFELQFIESQLKMCLEENNKRKKTHILALLGIGFIKLLKLPLTITSGIMMTLEKLSHKSKYGLKGEKMKQVQVNNPFKGLILGTGSMIVQVLKAISGIIVEPVSGGRKGGLKGFTKGVGKGLTGLIFKPVAGTIDIVTYTYRGIGNMTGKVYNNIISIKTKKQKKKNNIQQINVDRSQQDINKQEEEQMLICEDDDYQLYCNDSRVQEQIYQAILDNETIQFDEMQDKNSNKINEEQIESLIKFYQQQQNNYEEQFCEFLVLEQDEKQEQKVSRHNSPLLQSNKSSQSNYKSTYFKRNKSPSKIYDGSKTQIPSICIPHFLPQVSKFTEMESPDQYQTQIRNQSQTQLSPKVISSDSEYSEGDDQIYDSYWIEQQQIQKNIAKYYQFQENNGQKIKEIYEQNKLIEYDLSKCMIDLDIELNQDCKYQINKMVDLVQQSIKQGNVNLNPLNNVFDKQQNNDIQCIYKSGGKQLVDKKQTQLIRNVGKYVIQQFGKKILSGNSNLTSIGFPIHVNISKSCLQTLHNSSSLFPLYMNLALKSQSELERFYYLMVSILAGGSRTNFFGKPLNPILGETYQGNYNDGTVVYSEQISHHPPISYFLVTNLTNDYQYYGYYENEAKAGFNTLKIMNTGKRYLKFKDNNQLIEFSYASDQYHNCFLGTIRCGLSGKIEFIDQNNKIKCCIQFNKQKNQPSDYFESKILVSDKEVSTIKGNCYDKIYVDDKLVWDYYQVQPFQINNRQNTLPSDSTKRPDLLLMLQNQYQQAQQTKDTMELIQRKNKQLRFANKPK